MALLADIQASLMQSQELGPILLKLRFLAARLGSVALEEWVKFESEGYPAGSDVPDYRKFGVSYAGSFNGAFGRMATNIPIPSYLIQQLAGEAWLVHEERQSVSAIESLLATTAKSGANPQIDAANLILLLGTRVFQGMACHSATGTISRASMVEMQNTLRARVLELTIQLEKNVPGVMEIDVAQGAISEEPEKYAAVTNNITHNTVYGNQNTTSISNSGEGAQFAVEFHQGDMGALLKVLTDIGLEEEDAHEFATIVASETPEDNREAFGAKAKAWLGANLGKAADKVGFAVAAKLIGDAVARYYGLT